MALLMGGVALLSHHDAPPSKSRENPAEWLEAWRGSLLKGAASARMNEVEAWHYIHQTSPGLLLERWDVPAVVKLATDPVAQAWHRESASNALTMVQQGPRRKLDKFRTK